MTGITKSRTTSYYQLGNGMCKRFNRTLRNMLGTLEPEQRKNWKTYVEPLVHAYNCAQHDSTGFSPYYLMFGRNPRLPVDIFSAYEKNLKGQTTSKTSETVWITYTTLQPRHPSDPNRNRKNGMTREAEEPLLQWEIVS